MRSSSSGAGRPPFHRTDGKPSPTPPADPAAGAERDGDAEISNRSKDGENNKPKGESDDAKDNKKGKDDENDNKDKNKEKQERPTRRWPFVLGGLVAAFAIAVVFFELARPKPDVWTDDAYTRVHYAMVAPRVSGQIVAVPVDNNDLVHAGEVIVQLDPRDYEVAVAEAMAQVERDLAQSADIAATIDRQPALIHQSEAEVGAARARLSFAGLDARRYSNLAATGAGTGQQHQQADTTLKANDAALDAALAQLDANWRQISILGRQKQAADATIKMDQARLDQAQLNLGYTRIRAPVDGMISERSTQVGNVVSTATTLMTVIPLRQVYIDANCREVELKHMQTGQPVTIHVDAYDITLKGRVNAFPAATGASFAPIPPNNATGNFTKIVQRFPVRIDIDEDQPLARLLRAGMSVETTVHTEFENVAGEQARASRTVSER